MASEEKSLHFIEQIIEDSLASGFPQDQLRFRFPPEPNGYLHIGHAKSICLNFGLGLKYNAPVNLRFDDTNPAKEEQEYVDAIKEDLKWLGFNWTEELYSSDYFQQLYDWAVQMIKNGKAYVDSQTSEEMAAQKGTPTQPGVDGPYRNRSVEENLALFEAMKNGEFSEGTHVLRAKIDMASTNMLMRDPLMYRILHRHHHRTANEWKIYPMYDYAHGESDYLEQISHSICTLEFVMHRELYNWFLDQIYDANKVRPNQYEFARLNLNYWTRNNPSNEIWGMGIPGSNFRDAIFYQDASFLRIADVTFGYTLPKAKTDKMGIDQMRFYLQLINPAYFTKFLGGDPEYNGAAYQDDVPSSTVTFGFNLGF